MRRRQLIEIAEQAWCPRAVREGVTSYLQFAIEKGRVYAPVIPVLAAALRAHGETAIVDLCAGAGGPWRLLMPALRAEGIMVRVLLTDLYPNADAYALAERESLGAIRGELRPVNARNVPASFTGFRTMFSAFHHFDPHTACGILTDAAAASAGIAIVEGTHRSLRTIAWMCIVPFVVLLVMPFVRPLRFWTLFWTYLVPVVPLVIGFDGIVSCFRTYRADELLALSRDIGGGTMVWTSGEVGDGPIPVTYLIGVPVTR